MSTLTGGVWWPYCDEWEVTPAGALDIDHMVPLAGAWDSGAAVWTPARREAYADGQGSCATWVQPDRTRPDEAGGRRGHRVR